MQTTNDTKGNFFLKWDGGDHGVYEKITDPADPRSVMEYATTTDQDGRQKYHYGMRMSYRRNRVADPSHENKTIATGLVKHLAMFKTYIPDKDDICKQIMDGRVFDGMMARVYMCRRRKWNVRWEPYICITI